MGQDELQRGRRQGDVVGGADGFQPAHLGLNFCRRLAIGVMRRTGGPGDQNARGEGRADYDRNAALLQGSHAALQACLIQQRIGHRDQTEIQINARRNGFKRGIVIDAHAERLDIAGGFQILQGPDPAVFQLAHIARLLVAVKSRIQIMDHQRIDRIQRKALQRLFIGPHDTIIGVIKPHVEIQPACPGCAVELGRIGGAVQGAAHLGRQHEIRAGFGAQKRANPMFRQAAPIPRRRIVIAHARLPCCIQRGLALGFGHPCIQLTQMGRAKSKRRQVQQGLANASARRVRNRHCKDPPQRKSGGSGFLRQAVRQILV